MADTEMKKEFMRYALLDEPKSALGKLVSGTFRRFKECWEKIEKHLLLRKQRKVY
ncbi:hypothetical protein [Pseudobutyrivibrio sp. MD2005]|uniref:hypothetical protein n=1 Tax=Pseudobutyrivibrio sp. MD2005 TaxID=1410616 RepID=UPI001A99F9E1|nr:hypothetical protein [Pseudobutyrivibrio sp. MD2005]